MRKILLAAAAGVILAASPTSSDAKQCDDPDFYNQANAILAKSRSPLYSDGLHVLKTWGYRSNPYFRQPDPSILGYAYGHESQEKFQQSLLADRTAICVENAVTDHGEMQVYYGVKEIDGDAYILVKAVPGGPIEEPNPPPAPSPAPDNPPAVSHNSDADPRRWEDVLPRAKATCRSDWPDDYHMQAECLRWQKQGFEQVHGANAAPSPVTPSPAKPDNSAAAPAGFRNQDDSVPTPRIQMQKTTPTQSSMEHASISATPALHGNGPVFSAPNPAFGDGLIARMQIEEWINGLTQGDYRDGVLFWAAHRSDKKSPGCHYKSATFETGCLEAKRRLDPTDLERKSKPDYRLGWNSYTQPQ